MRRSLRDAIVGFSLIGGVLIFSGTMFWLRGFRLGSKAWYVTAIFKDASGLAELSPVTYRGIVVGSVDKINFKLDSVEAIVKIQNKDLILNKPVIAKVITSSILGGDTKLSLVDLGKFQTFENPNPLSKDCPAKIILCDGDKIQGEKLTSISSLTKGIEKIINKAGKVEIVNSLSNSIEQFDKTQANLDELIVLSKAELKRAEPIITELAEAANHLNNILATIDNPKTLNDIKDVANSTKSITNKIDQITNNLEGLIKDKELIDAIRKITIGLGKLFNEIYYK